MKLASLTVVVVAAGLTLSGCGLLPSAPTAPSPSASAESPSPSPSASPTPIVPEERDASTRFDEWDAYLACRQLTPSYFYTDNGGDFYEVKYASFADSFIHERADGLFFVYSEVENGNEPPASASLAAANCVVGGTLGNPQYAQFGSTIRLSAAELDAAKDAPLDSP